MRDAVGQGRSQTLFGSGPYRRDVVGWLVHWITEPPVRLRVRTTPSFVPAAVEPKESVSRLRYNLYSCLRVIPAHQRQHLSQAEQVARSLRSLGGAA